MTWRRFWIRWLLIGGVAAAIVLAILLIQERSLTSIKRRLEAGDAAGALAAADEFLRLRPGHGPATALRARALVATGRIEEALPLFEQAGAADADDLRAWSAALLGLERIDQALPILERLLQLDPTNPETLDIVTLCRWDLQRYPAAVESAQQLAELPGQEALGHLHLATIYQDWGYASQANEHFARVLELAPDLAGLPQPPEEVLLRYGQCLLLAGNARRALEVLHRSAQLQPSPQAALRRAEAHQMLGEHARAQELLRPLVAQDPQQREARERLAESALQLGNAAEAVTWLQPLLDGAATSAHAAYLLQRAYTALEDEEQARQWQEKAAALRLRDRRLRAWRTAAQADSRSPRYRVLTAYEAATRGDWQAAGKALAALLRQSPQSYEEPFVQQLVEAVQQKGPLPPLESIPESLASATQE